MSIVAMTTWRVSLERKSRQKITADATAKAVEGTSVMKVNAC